MDTTTAPPASAAWLSAALLCAALTLGLFLLRRRLVQSRDYRENIPPFPARAYPVLGHLPYLARGMREVTRTWTRETGDMFSLYLGPHLAVVLSSYDAVHEAFVKNADSMSDRPQSFAASAIELGVNKGIITSSGHLWKEQRTVSLQILRSFGMGKNILAEKVTEEVRAYLEALGQLGGQPRDVSTLTNNAVSNIICSTIVGKRFDYDNAQFIELLGIMGDMFRLNRGASLFNSFPWLRFLPGDLFKAKRRIEAFGQVHRYFADHYIAKVEREYEESNPNSFIAAYLCEMKKADRQGRDTTLDKSNLSRVLVNLFSAGTDTTSTTILWFMVYMLNFPAVQTKIFQEIKEIVGPEREPTMHDRTRLNYTNAAIMETQRLASIAPNGVPHQCNRDTVIKGYTIPAGTMIISHLDGVLLSEDTWDSPLEFKPERFLDVQGNITQPEQFIPFSTGRRLCLGESLARMELFLFLTSLVQRFELLPAEPGCPPRQVSVPGLVNPPEKFQIRFVDRREL